MLNTPHSTHYWVKRWLSYSKGEEAASQVFCDQYGPEWFANWRRCAGISTLSVEKKCSKQFHDSAEWTLLLHRGRHITCTGVECIARYSPWLLNYTPLPVRGRHVLDWALRRTATTVSRAVTVDEHCEVGQDEHDHQGEAEEHHGAWPDNNPTDTSTTNSTVSGRAPWGCIY